MPDIEVRLMTLTLKNELTMSRYFLALLQEILKVYESDSRIDYTEAEQLEKVLLHPLTQCFLNLKWHQIRIFYYVLMLSHIVFSLIYSFYVYALYRYVI